MSNDGEIVVVPVDEESLLYDQRFEFRRFQDTGGNMNALNRYDESIE